MSTAELSREDELAALIAEQEKDDAYGDTIRYSRDVSLELAVGEDGATLSDFVGEQDATLVEFTGGYDYAVRRIPRPQRWTRRGIVSHIRAWVKEHGEPPLYTDWNFPNGRGIPSAASVARRFGSWNAGIRAAGLEPRPVGGPRNLNPGSEKARRRVKRRRVTARLNADQVAAAYVLYERQGLSMNDLADRLWQRYDYPSPVACRQALRQAFHADGYRIRTRSEARMKLPAERRRAIAAHAREARRYTHLTPKQLHVIRTSTLRQVDLAEMLGVSQSAVSRVKRGQTYLAAPSPSSAVRQ